MITSRTLTGTAAITAAETLSLTLSKYADPTEGARTGITIDEAREIAGEDPSLIWIAAADLAIAHAYREGHEDYTDRAADVAAGQQEEEWAWPFVSADGAYINAVTTSAICEACGLAAEAWDEIADVWCAAFARGYRAAHAEVQS